jgi:hypothetical protein
MKKQLQILFVEFCLLGGNGEMIAVLAGKTQIKPDKLLNQSMPS